MSRAREVRFHLGARNDLLEAATWYEERVPGLGVRFQSAVEDTLRAIVDAPERFRLVHRDIRRAILVGFPYALYFVLLGDTVHVIACMHGRRRSRRWQSRRRDV